MWHNGLREKWLAKAWARRAAQDAREEEQARLAEELRERMAADDAARTERNLLGEFAYSNQEAQRQAEVARAQSEAERARDRQIASQWMDAYSHERLPRTHQMLMHRYVTALDRQNEIAPWRLPLALRSFFNRPASRRDPEVKMRTKLYQWLESNRFNRDLYPRFFASLFPDDEYTQEYLRGMVRFSERPVSRPFRQYQPGSDSDDL